MDINEIWEEIEASSIGGDIDLESAEIDEDGESVSFETWDGDKYVLSLQKK